MRKWLLSLALLAAAGCPRSDGPEAVVWDRQACAQCRMHIGDPRFAAQLQTAQGEVRNFDDPGCLFEHLEEQRPEVKRLWFRHRAEDRWLPGERVAFAEGATPMGHGLAAVDPGTPGAIPLAAARERTLERRATRRQAKP